MRARAILVGILVMLLSAGCAQLGLQSSTIRVPRTQAALAYADAKELYGGVKATVQAACRAGAWSAEQCSRAESLDQQIQALDQRIRTTLADDGGFDPQAVEHLLRLVLRYAPLAVPRSREGR